MTDTPSSSIAGAGDPILAPSSESAVDGEQASRAAVATPGTWRRMGRRLRVDKPAMVAATFLVLLVLAAIFAPLIAAFDPNQQGVGMRFEGPSTRHWLGTDDLGRDTFSRLLFGSRVSLRTGAQVLVLALLFAVPVGLVSGFRGGLVDNVIMRFMDALASVPGLVLALAVVGILGHGLERVAIALAIVIAPSFVRLVRAQTLAVREETFIEASESIGTPERVVLRKRVLPNVISPLIVAVALASGSVLVAESSLALLGFGPKPPQATWGGMLQRGYTVIFTEPWQILIPGLVLAATVLAFNTLGDGIRDALGLGLPRVAGVKGRLGLTSVKNSPAVANATPTDELLNVRGLTVEFHTHAGPVTVVDDVSLSVRRGEVLGLVGESGSGKSVTSMSIMRLLPTPPARIVRGSVTFDGRELLTASFEEMRRIRGREISMVFQDPMTSINPAFTVGNQIIEIIRRHNGGSKAVAERRAEELLNMVGIPDPRRRLEDYPHQMSGGMRQRVLLAMALAAEPRLLIADEPTTALDVTVQAQILDLIRKLQQEMDLAVIFVTHDLGVVADICDRVAVMYAGQIVEESDVDSLFERPRHPYTEGLLAAIPQVDESDKAMVSIPGVVPAAAFMPQGCRFAPRCAYATSECSQPVELVFGDERHVRCIHTDRLTLGGVR